MGPTGGSITTPSSSKTFPGSLATSSKNNLIMPNQNLIFGAVIKTKAMFNVECSLPKQYLMHPLDTPLGIIETWKKILLKRIQPSHVHDSYVCFVEKRISIQGSFWVYRKWWNKPLQHRVVLRVTRNNFISEYERPLTLLLGQQMAMTFKAWLPACPVHNSLLKTPCSPLTFSGALVFTIVPSIMPHMLGVRPLACKCCVFVEANRVFVVLYVLGTPQN